MILLGWLSVLAGCSPSGSTGGPIGAAADEQKSSEPKVEIKVAVAEVDTGPAVLGVDPSDVELREVSFYDVPGLALFDRGIILRTRRVTDGEDDSTVKLRPLGHEQVSKDLFEVDGFKCELDKSVGKDAVSSCSYSAVQGEDEIAQVAAAVGFSDQSHLTRFFRRVYGMTPGVYAKAVRPAM